MGLLWPMVAYLGLFMGYEKKGSANKFREIRIHHGFTQAEIVIESRLSRACVAAVEAGRGQHTEVTTSLLWQTLNRMIRKRDGLRAKQYSYGKMFPTKDEKDERGNS